MDDLTHATNEDLAHPQSLAVQKDMLNGNPA